LWNRAWTRLDQFAAKNQGEEVRLTRTLEELFASPGSPRRSSHATSGRAGGPLKLEKLKQLAAPAGAKSWVEGGKYW